MAKAAARPPAGNTRRTRARTLAPTSVDEQVQRALAALERASSKAVRDGMARYAIPARHAFGVSMGRIQAIAKKLGRSHELAAALWESGWYEARMLACFVDQPERVTAMQMDRWCRGFDNWAICDTACFALFDRTPHAWRKVEKWAARRDEFVKRAAFALLASLTVHDKQAHDRLFLAGLRLVEREAGDARNFVKKAINWALRSIGKRNAALNAAAVGVAQRLAASAHAAPRWVGKSALREITGAAVLRRLAAKAA